MPTDLDLAELRRRAIQARELVALLARDGDRHWRMCVPPQADDADVLLDDVLGAVPALLDRLEAAEREVERLRAAYDELYELHNVPSWS